MQMIKRDTFLKFFTAFAAVILLFGTASYAQNPDSLKIASGVDSLKMQVADSLAVAADSLTAGADSLAAKKEVALTKAFAASGEGGLPRILLKLTHIAK